MAITITNNTNLLRQLKTAVENLPTKDDVTVDLSPTDAGSLDILSPKRAYLVSANGTPTMVTGTMSNLGNPTYEVGVSGSTTKTVQGYVNNVTVKFSDELNAEIATQGELLNQIANLLATKIL